MNNAKFIFGLCASILFAPAVITVAAHVSPAPGLGNTDAYPALVGFNCQASPYIAFADEEDEFPGTCDDIFPKDEVCVTDASLEWLTPDECTRFLRGEYAR